MSSLEQHFLELARAANVNLTDATRVVCDICNTDGSESRGGYVLEEKPNSIAAQLGSFTYACSRCHATFTCASEEERARLTGFEQAMKWGVGTDPKETMKLDENKSFRDNVLSFKRFSEAHGTTTSWTTNISRTKAGEVPLPEAERKTGTNEDIVQPLELMCKACRKILPKKDFKKCGRCMWVCYCSRECQREDWQKHKLDCVPRSDWTKEIH